MRTRSATLIVVAAPATACGGSAPHASLTLKAASGYADAPVVHTSGNATLHATWSSYPAHLWTSSVALRAGTVTLHGARFLATMRPTGPAFKHLSFSPPPVGPSPVALSVVAGGKTIAGATLWRRVTPASLQLRGGEAALLVASTFPRLIHGAIGLVPDATVYPQPPDSWTLHGKAVPVQPIRVERIRGPVLTAGAGDDKLWPSASSVRAVERRLRRHGFRYFHQGVVYPAAGHLIGTALPYEPASTEASSLGGVPRADEAGREDLWPRILRYFARL